MKAIAATVTLIVAVVFTGLCGAFAQNDPACGVASALVSPDFRLSHVAKALTKKELTVAVVGSGSSTLPDVKKAYPARLEEFLAGKLPGVTVKVVTQIKAREAATDVVPQLRKFIAVEKPSLVVWQTGTVEAMRGVEPDTFSGALQDGIDAAIDARSDIILMNMQYSPRTELMISMPPYADAIRIVALQHEILLFDRLAIMRRWGELGTFDLNEVTKKMDTAFRIHDCIGRLLGDLILEAARLPASSESGLK
jgi:hypothetical protein